MTTISIGDNDARIQHSIGGGGNTANSTQFTIDFPFFSLDDINVIITNSSGVDTTLTRGTGSNTFAVTGTAVDDGFSGGNITLGSVYTSSTVTIFRDVPITRTSDFATSGPFNISSLNTDLDKIYAVMQQIENKNDRALTMAESDDANEISLPNKAARKGNVLAFNATTGAAEAGPSIGSVTTVSAQSSNINTLAGISANITTVAGISSNVTTVAGISGNVTTVAGISSNISSVVSNASNINTVAGAISNVNSVASAVTNINTVAGITSNIASVASDATDIGTVAGSISNVNTVASNISSINDFSARYRVASSDPSSSLDVGDLYFDTTNNQLKVYKDTGWIAASAFGNLSSDTTPELGGNLDLLTHSIVSTSNRNIELTPNGSGVVRIDGSTGVDISQGAISIKNGGSQSYIRLYCESSNAHYVQFTAPAHSDFSGNITVVLPATAGTLALTSQLPTSGISSGNVATFTSGVADDDFLRVNGTTIEGRSASELASDIGAATTDDIVALAIALG